MTQTYIWSNWLSIYKIYVKLNGLIIKFEIGVSIQCFRRRVFVLCIWTSHVLTVTDENRERCIFPILLVNVPRSYRDNASLVSTIFSHFFEFLKIKQHIRSKHYWWWEECLYHVFILNWPKTCYMKDIIVGKQKSLMK